MIAINNPNVYVDYSNATLHEIYFAGGCFWGVQAFLACIYGVASTEVGYANGRTANPSYEDVCRLNTGHAEAVKVSFDPERVGLEELLTRFFGIIDPTALNRQGNDVGSQYRSGIFYVDEADRPVIEGVVAEVQKGLSKPVVTEVMRLECYYSAEEYHQDYLVKNPSGYCHIDFKALEAQEGVDPGNYARKADEALRGELGALAFGVTRRNETEAPFSSPEYQNTRPGIYVDVTTGEPLFSWKDKFDAGCGWPSFSRAIDPKVVRYEDDRSHGMRRTEVRSRVGDSHLGHVFNDGPREAGGMRYCINGAALRFVPIEEMDKEGYGRLIAQVM